MKTIILILFTLTLNVFAANPMTRRMKELNEKLIPNARNDELKSLLNKNVEKIKNRLEVAPKLQRDIL